MERRTGNGNIDVFRDAFGKQSAVPERLRPILRQAGVFALATFYEEFPYDNPAQVAAEFVPIGIRLTQDQLTAVIAFNTSFPSAEVVLGGRRNTFDINQNLPFTMIGSTVRTIMDVMRELIADPHSNNFDDEIKDAFQKDPTGLLIVQLSINRTAQAAEDGYLQTEQNRPQAEAQYVLTDVAEKHPEDIQTPLDDYIPENDTEEDLLPEIRDWLRDMLHGIEIGAMRSSISDETGIIRRYDGSLTTYHGLRLKAKDYFYDKYKSAVAFYLKRYM